MAILFLAALETIVVPLLRLQRELPKSAAAGIRALDMCRTTVNVWSDSCGAAVIASNMGEQ